MIVVLAVFRLEDVVTGQRELPWVLVDVALIALASYFVISGLGRRAAALLHRTESEETCPACHHVWLEHGLEGPSCGECEYEIEHEDPDAPASPCRAEPPASSSTGTHP
ncbi:hypothetical protein WDV85_12105 [Pseudokineococcus sp. 5B2Z-1]|uniref:hypothetical protein n=1 Tax=Pseudokineococcus sp. 5B2Z-1 TaxID=3132744 RepID=UPI0030A3C3DD